MKLSAIRRFRCPSSSRRRERGVTMVLVALAMVAIIAMAALSIDVITLYLAREEAQRSADAAALAAARVISMSGLTGDPNNSTSTTWQAICGGASSPASQAATAVATQSAVGSAVANVNVTYSASGIAAPNCSSVTGGAFGVNPLVTVQITRASLPTFFSRIWGSTGNSVSATATAEAFNPSASDLNRNGGPTGTVTPVQPRCVKPWIVPNRDPLNPNNTCDQGGGPCSKFVSLADGSIINPGISMNGNNASGVIGETFWLAPDCIHTGNKCSLRANPPVGNYYAVTHRPWLEPPPSLEYLPGEVPAAVPPVAVPSCASSGGAYEEAVGGCDQTIYQCGLQSLNPNQVDLNENPGAGSNDTLNGVQCLIHQTDPTDITSSSGQDYLKAFAAPNSYPFQILAGSGNPLVTMANPPLTGATPVTSSTSIVSLPIYDDTAATITANGTSNVTIVGFLQVFINAVDQWGSVNVTILNVAGCGNGSTPPNAAVTGSSPVPVRLITPQ